MASLVLGAAMATCLTTPALAESKPSTRLVTCGTDSCLLVTGHRQSADAEVRINGHPVVVQGERSWRVRLPVSTVREWSAPFARKIEVSSYNPAMSTPASHAAKLPIGLLGHVPDLASLVITLN
jgi:hypothetical protein